jgi:hypothetical protein
MRRTVMSLSFVVSVLLAGSSSPPLYAGDALSPQDLVTKHLDALGTKEARTTIKTRVVQGTAVYRILVGGGGRLEGKTGIASEGHKLRFMLKFAPNDYRGETAVYNGQAVQVAFSNANQSRSPLASFLTTYDVIVKDGLLGGVLSTAWPLINLEDRRPQLIYEGLKKLDGKQVHQIRYQPNGHNDLEILLYFDSEFRHVGTSYGISVANNVGATITSSSRLLPERSRLEERFSDFKTVDGIKLPTHWNLQFTRELPNGSTTVTEWDMKEE